ncbi:MAG: glutamine synthetase family protein [Alphaproteobacteria bacterium]
MTTERQWPVRYAGDAAHAMRWLRQEGVERVRLEWVDFNGIARGKAFTLSQFERGLERGFPFCATALAFDIKANVVPGTDLAESIGYADFVALPDFATMRLLRHESATAQVMADLVWPDHRPVECDPRYVLKKVTAEAEALGFAPMAAAELEFYLLDDQHRLVDKGRQAYSLQKRAQWLAEEYAILDAARAHGEIEASHYEYGPGQFEINIRYRDIRGAADDGHLFRATIKEAALAIGRRVTFMAKPFDKVTGNSCHIHLSLERDGRNAFADRNAPDHLSPTCRHFVGGVLAHMKELTAIFFPNANSYRRIVPGLFAPISLAWGVDNRTAAIRIINEVEAATRVELRVCGGDAHLPLAFAAYLAAGLDGIRNRIEPGPAAAGDLDVDGAVERLPDDWGRALDAFEASSWVKQALGAVFVKNYGTVKRHEYDEWRRTVTAEERDSYIEWL